MLWEGNISEISLRLGSVTVALSTERLFNAVNVIFTRLRAMTAAATRPDRLAGGQPKARTRSGAKGALHKKRRQEIRKETGRSVATDDC